MTGTSHRDQQIFLILSCQILLRVTNFSGKICRENLTTHFMLNIFFPENNALCGITRKNLVELEGPQMNIWNMLVTCYVYKATKTHSEQVYVILTALPRHSGCANEPQCYVSTQKSVLLKKINIIFWRIICNRYFVFLKFTVFLKISRSSNTGVDFPQGRKIIIFTGSLTISSDKHDEL